MVATVFIMYFVEVGCQVVKTPCHKGFATCLRLSEVDRGCQDFEGCFRAHQERSAFAPCLYLVKLYLKIVLERSNSLDRTHLRDNRRLEGDEFSREFRG